MQIKINSMIKNFFFRFSGNFLYSLLKRAGEKKNSLLCDLYFPKKCRSTDKVLSTINDIYTFLENKEFINEKNRIDTYIKSIIFIDDRICSSWNRSGGIIIELDSSFSENFFYVLGILVWYSHCLEYWSKNKSLSYIKRTAKASEKLLLFFERLEKLDENAKPIGKYFRDLYESRYNRILSKD